MAVYVKLEFEARLQLETCCWPYHWPIRAFLDIFIQFHTSFIIETA